MDPSYGITSKLLIWFCALVLIFYGTIFVLYINLQRAVILSESIVNKNYAIATMSKKMIENLISMEENEKKYGLLHKNDYLTFFAAAQKAFEDNLVGILELEAGHALIPAQWHEIYESYRQFPNAAETEAYVKNANKRRTLRGKLWIPESVINQWIAKIRQAQSENTKEVEASTRELSRRSQMAARNGLFGLVVSSVIGLIGVAFLAYSMIRPLRELIKGIRSITKDRDSKPIKIRSKDEFGELAGAFNEMTERLRREERMRSDFISMLSHEIRTPLTSIRESVNMIVEEVMGPITERQHKFLNIASSEIGRICDLLNHLMQASRLEPGKLKVVATAVDCYTLVNGSVDTLKNLARTKGIRISVQCDVHLPNVLGDSQQLRQVILNLLGNAIKFSPQGSRVNVRAEADSDPRLICFTVQDHGPGIGDDELALLFNKYYRAQNVRAHMDGVGLGLSIAKNIIEAHKGSIWVDSHLGRGSTFGFTLPKAPPGFKPQRG
jgi:signal transduction histidine kinase